MYQPMKMAKINVANVAASISSAMAKMAQWYICNAAGWLSVMSAGFWRIGALSNGESYLIS
jgi:hypothetical protein